MSRLYVRFHIALLGSLIVFAVLAGLFWHFGGGQAFGHSVFSVILALSLLGLAVAIVAYPLVRRLTQRLERLQLAVESLGAGDLSARVPVEGADEVAQLARSFNRAAARIEELVDAHKSFLANTSHELRTPLTRIRMATELIKDSADPKRKAGLDQDIAELDSLIDEILLASRLDAVARLDVNEPVDVLALAAEECARYDAVQLDGTPVVVDGDPRLLRRLLRNLVENAQRHGEPPVCVRVAATAQGAEVGVTDQGRLIPPDERARLFDPFFRRADRINTTGTGLGLALVRRIAQHHGGDVTFVETPDRHNSFVVTLPARSAERR